MVKVMEYMKSLEYTEPNEPTDQTYRSAYKNWERKFKKYDQNLHNW